MRMTHSLFSLLAGGTACLFASMAPAAIVSYQISGADNTAKRAPTSVDSNVSASSIVNGAGMSTSGTLFKEFPSSSGDYIIVNRSNYISGVSTEAEAVTAATFYRITLTPNLSVTMTLQTLNFDTLWYNADPSATMFVRSDAGGDNFSTNLGSYDVTTNTRTPRSINLSASAVDFSGTTAPISFRFYMYSTIHANNNTAGLDNIELIGVVPEPASMGLVLIGGAGLLLRRRRA